MTQRIDYANASPEGLRKMQELEAYVRRSGIEASLLELIKIRASQMNGCAFCIDMHTKDARAHGETEQRIYALDAWRETPFFSSRERVALEWTEAVTNIQQGHAPDEIFEQAKAEFGEQQLVELTLAMTTINAWNRLAIAFRLVVGNYQPAVKTAAS